MSTTPSTITVQQFLEARNKFEKDLTATISDMLNNFQQRTGLHPSYVNVNIEPLDTIGEPRTHILTSVKLYFEI